ncbi:MAG: hypothetical protein ACYDBH_02955 [Acidobacteriaceae bacterium]
MIEQSSTGFARYREGNTERILREQPDSLAAIQAESEIQGYKIRAFAIFETACPDGWADRLREARAQQRRLIIKLKSTLGKHRKRGTTADRRSRNPARGSRASRAACRSAGAGGDSGGDPDPDPDPESEPDPSDHAPDRRSHSSADAHSYAAWDPDDPAPQCRTTVWPVIPDPVVFHGVCASSWRQISAFADGRVREVCRLLGADIEIDDAADELLCSGHTARDDAKEIYDAIVSKRINVAAQQLDLFADPEPAYIPKRSSRGRKKKSGGGTGGAK